MGLGKNIAVAGFGKSGRALAAHALSGQARVTVFDDNAPADLPAGVHYGGALSALVAPGFDEVWVSPGIVPGRLPVAPEKLTGELDLAQAGVLPHQKVVAITGTNGKTTTTELVHHLLLHGGIQSVAVGNIGEPWISALNPGVQVYVVEVSSFQLALSRVFHPQVAILTNIALDHLDWHGSQADYAAAKWRIAGNQTEDDVLVLGQTGLKPSAPVRGQIWRAVWGEDVQRQSDALIFKRPHACQLDIRSFRLRGDHNLQNLAMAAMAVMALGVMPEQIEAALPGFAPSPHRQQHLGEAGGVLFVNDSKGTNPHAVLGALENVRNPILIYGGFDKGLDDEAFLKQQLPRLKGLVLLGPLGARLWPAFAGAPGVDHAPTLAVAFGQAVALAKPGDTVLLSPGSSSFDEFADYTKRGDAFARLVEQHKKEAGS